jgi:hypothetical protein
MSGKSQNLGKKRGLRESGTWKAAAETRAFRTMEMPTAKV